ncbi:MAG: exodeoxyribonuclease III [Sutterellaceae bacterium]|nr:exodeoxyribonuclease III [Burkholderiaceae bacterium]MCX7901549.1 exodeoxyribonuclease III [Burkholderiaceae bacterium]MDW8430145.1 exodeoxyribonuclease III [Sutterellaceae bacterium]
MFRIITLNTNGIRSAASKGLFTWVQRADPDVLCLQEVKADEADIPEPYRYHDGLRSYFFCAKRKGYAGTALYTKKVPRQVRRGFGVPEFDEEGRYLEAEFAHVTVVSVYFPSGSAGPERQASKYRFLDAFFPHLARLRESGREVIVCGDVNIAHKEIDLKNWRSNQKHSGFLPEERAWLTRVFDELGYVDVFRRLDPRPEQYTWWSNRGQAYAKNVGWRIDYQLATPGIAAKAKAAYIYKERRFSDHAPLIIEYSGRL